MSGIFPQSLVSASGSRQSNATATATVTALPDDHEEPLYVNPKQYHRILRRREVRAHLEATGRIPKERQVIN